MVLVTRLKGIYSGLLETDAGKSDVFAICPFRRLFSHQGVLSHGKESS